MMSCKFAADQAVVGESFRQSGQHADEDAMATPSSVVGNAQFPSTPLALGSGSGTAAQVAQAATSMIGIQNCSLYPPKGLKCAQQASDILRAAGVKVSGSLAVNGLVSQLKALGWRDVPGPCLAGSVQHTGGLNPIGRHIGVVGTDNKAVHNSSSQGSSWRCGRLTNRDYPSWKARARCLVAPK